MARTNPPPIADPKDVEGNKSANPSIHIILVPWLLTGTETNTANSRMCQLKNKEIGRIPR